MKSIHLTNAWHATSGGIATHYRSLLKEAELTGRQMVMVIPGERDGVENGQTTRIHTVAASPSPFNSAYRSIMPNQWPGVHSRVRQIILDEQPDLIEVCDKYSLHYLAGAIRKGYIKGLRKRPVLVGLSCERMDDNLGVYLTKSPLGKAFAAWYMKWVYFGFFDHHIVNSNHVADELRLAARGHVTERGIWVRPPGIDLSSFKPLSQDQNAPTVLYAGRLAPEKNLQLLIDSFALLPQDFRLVVAGDGIERQSLEAAANQRFPGRATFLGHINSKSELARLYASASVFVHTNPAEPFGIAPLEAMASGLPLVAPHSGGILTYANSTNAWLTKANAPALAEAILDTFDPDLRQSRTAAALATAAQYHAPHTARRFLDMYEQFMQNRLDSQPDYRSTPGTWLGVET